MTEPPSRRFRCFRPRLSLRTLMLVVLVVGVALGWYVTSARRQAETVAIIRNLGGTVWYDWEYRDGEFVPNPQDSAWPSSMIQRLGPDFLGHVAAVSLKEPLDQYDPGIITRLRALPRLEFLDSSLFPNQSEIELLSQIDQLKHVRIMVFKGSPIDLRPLTKLKRLESLDLFLNALDEMNLEFLSDLRMLKKFYLSADQVTDSGLASLRGVTNLEELEIRSEPLQSSDGETDLKLTSSGLTHLAGMKQLKRLHFGDTRISDLTEIGQLTSLRDLSLDRGSLDDAGFAPIAKLTDLDSLSIPEGTITDQGLVAQAKLTRLKKLQLGSEFITDAGLVHLAELANLKEFGISSDKISDQGLVAIARFSNLKKLFLSSSKITDAGMESIARLSKLEELWIEGANLTDAAIVPLGRLTTCKIISLPGGRYPTCISPSAFAQLKAKLPGTTFNPVFGVACGSP